MEKRHENALNDLLEKVAFQGFATVDKWLMARWYGQEKFTIGIRRDIRARWNDMASESMQWLTGVDVELAESDQGQILLIRSNIKWDKED